MFIRMQNKFYIIMFVTKFTQTFSYEKNESSYLWRLWKSFNVNLNELHSFNLISIFYEKKIILQVKIFHFLNFPSLYILAVLEMS